MAKMVQFVNPFVESFTWTWNSDSYTFKPGQPTFMEDWKADHFAKHLVDRELLMGGKMVNHSTRAELLKKCILKDEEVVVSDGKVAMELAKLNKSAKRGPKAKVEAPVEEKEEFEEIKA